MLRNRVTSHTGKRNGSLVPRTRGSNVPSASADQCPIIRQRQQTRLLAYYSPKPQKFCGAFSKATRIQKQPPYSNRGVTRPPQYPTSWLYSSIKRGTMKITKHLDWISVTFPAEVKPTDVFPALEWGYAGEGVHGYRTKHIDALTGAIAFSDGHTANMGMHIQLSGSVLSELRETMGGTDAGIMEHLTNYNGLCSRVDLALNIHGGKTTPATLFRAFKAGNIKSTARKCSYIKGYENGITGMTFYAGNRQSDRFFRAYDKNAESKITSMDAWLRLELELKRVWARGAQGAVKEHGVSAVVNAQFNDFMQWSNEEYTTALQGDSAPIDEHGRQPTNTEKWLMEQVSVALARVCVAKPGFLAQFMQRVRQEIDSLNYRRSQTGFDTNP